MSVTSPTVRPDQGGRSLSTTGYLAGLDGVRALAVIAVMVYHADSSWLPGGFLGVEVFFVLSGYLITLLLMAETERTGRIDIAAFWIRRARRLLPALLVLVAGLTIWMTLFESSSLGRARGDIVAGLLYVSNWYQIWVGQGYAAVGDFAPLRHLWSLAVEEQFYLVWPVVMAVVLRGGTRRTARPALLLTGIAVVVTVLVALAHHPGRIGECAVTPEAYWQVGERCLAKADTLYLSTITRSTGLLLGAAFAMVWRPAAIMRGPLRHRPRRLDVAAVVGLAVLVMLTFRVHFLRGDDAAEGVVADGALFRGGFLLTAVATLAVIAAVTHRRSSIGRALGFGPLVWVGTRSYGLYLFHWPIYQVLRQVAGASLGIGRFVVAMILTGLVTEASYRFLEMPVRRGEGARTWARIRERQAPGARRAVTLLGVALGALLVFSTVRLALADVELNEIEATIVAGEQQVTSVDDLLGELPTGADAVTGTATDPLTGVEVTVDSVAIAPQREPIEFLAIGDSVMLGAAGELFDRGYTVNAEQNRQMSDVLPFMQQLRDSGALGGVLVVHLGTNGPISETTMRAFLTIVADVGTVVMLNVRGDVEWAERNNALLASLDGPDDNLIVVDWAREAENCTGSCFAGDGIHLSADGQVHYANVIRDVTGR
ncbi:MAG: hypothetical protein RIR49_967 [Actinomycetota bacterium]